jgi:hypothetical protein
MDRRTPVPVSPLPESHAGIPSGKFFPLPIARMSGNPHEGPAMEPAPRPHPRAPLPSASFACASFPREEMQDLMDRLPSSMALVDDAGEILAINAAWRSVGEDNAADTAQTGIGANYLAACDAAALTGDREAEHFAEGLRSVIRGTCDTYKLESGCVLAGEPHLVCGRVTRLADPLARYVMVSHETLTAVHA